MVDPTFLVIGAQKSGTSWLSECIRQHPDAFSPPRKELHFFNKRDTYRQGIEWYRRQFDGYSGEKAVGEYTPNYIWTSTDQQEIEESGRNQDIPKLVHSHYPDIKLIVSLRNPVDRAVSAYFHHIRARRIPPHSRILNVKDKYGIVSMGFYSKHLEKWLEFFKPDQFLILIYEDDIVKNKEQTLRRVYKFIGVDDSYRPLNTEGRYNSRSSHFYMRMNYYSPLLAKALVSILPSYLIKVQFWTIPITEREIEQLRQIYRGSNEQLSALIGRQLPW